MSSNVHEPLPYYPCMFNCRHRHQASRQRPKLSEPQSNTTFVLQGPIYGAELTCDLNIHCAPAADKTLTRLKIGASPARLPVAAGPISPRIRGALVGYPRAPQSMWGLALRMLGASDALPDRIKRKKRRACRQLPDKLLLALLLTLLYQLIPSAPTTG